MDAELNTEPELLTTDQVCDRLAGEPALRRVAALCVLPMVAVEGGGVRFRRADFDAWVAREHAAVMAEGRPCDARPGAGVDGEGPAR